MEPAIKIVALPLPAPRSYRGRRARRQAFSVRAREARWITRMILRSQNFDAVLARAYSDMLTKGTGWLQNIANAGYLEVRYIDPMHVGVDFGTDATKKADDDWMRGDQWSPAEQKKILEGCKNRTGAEILARMQAAQLPYK